MAFAPALTFHRRLSFPNQTLNNQLHNWFLQAVTRQRFISVSFGGAMLMLNFKQEHVFWFLRITAPVHCYYICSLASPAINTSVRSSVSDAHGRRHLCPFEKQQNFKFSTLVRQDRERIGTFSSCGKFPTSCVTCASVPTPQLPCFFKSKKNNSPWIIGLIQRP